MKIAKIFLHTTLLILSVLGSSVQAISSDSGAPTDTEDQNWVHHGRTHDEQRYSPLDSINVSNVSELGLEWSYQFPSPRGKEGTPLMVDGTLYVTGSWSRVYAFNGRTGALLWAYDPAVPKELAGTLCCDVVNRGVAYWQGKIYVGTLDGRLIALQSDNGKELWSAQTTPKGQPYSITGAPRVVKGKVIIGNGGAEMLRRGFVSAYDAESGDLVWRFYTVPGNPAEGVESPAMEMAAKTWSGEWWQYGGGGTAWDSFAYDDENELLYIGVGNGAPWSHIQRSEGKGDNLFLSSIVAVRPDTGEYVWHYQTTPKDSWDYTATQHMILADLEIDGQIRKVIMQAPKNGFFYVIDRLSGELLSAEKYTYVTWASHVDLKTGRPVENPGMHYGAEEAKVVFPGPLGGHSFQPMSYSPDTGLVYIPANNIPGVHRLDKQFGKRNSYWRNGTDWLDTAPPEDPEGFKAAEESIFGELIAWDPVTQQPRWKVDFPNVWNGGLLSTAGGLVFQGNAEGKFVAYKDDDGKILWDYDTVGGIIASPVTYTIDGKQYVAIMSGWGGGYGSASGKLGTRSAGSNKQARLMVFALGGSAALPEETPVTRSVDTAVLAFEVDADKALAGKSLYMHNCHFCHGVGVVSPSSIPDLRYLSEGKHQLFKNIVLDGLFQVNGMPSFEGRLNEEEVSAIQQYILQRAQADLGENSAKAK